MMTQRLMVIDSCPIEVSSEKKQTALCEKIRRDTDKVRTYLFMAPFGYRKKEPVFCQIREGTKKIIVTWL